MNRRKIHFLSGISFILGFLDAFFLYVTSSYFALVSGSDNVGGFYLVIFLVVFGILFVLARVMRFLGKIRTLLFVLMILFGASAFLSLRDPSWTGAALVLIFLSMSNTLWVVLDILLEDYSSDHLTGRVRGMYLTVMNAGLLLAPFLATHVLEFYGYGGIFAVLTIGYALVFGTVLIGLKNESRVEPSMLHFGTTWRKLIRRGNLARIYHISFAMEFFYAIMIVYTPLYLLTVVGFGWEEIGTIFTIMLIPFVILQYPLGILADTRWGERELLFSGLLIMAFGTVLVGGVSMKSVFVWALILFITRVGTAAIEVLRDSYFYKQIDSRDTDIIAFFRTARPLANIFGSLIALILLLFFQLQALFFVIVLVLLTAALSAWTLEDSVSEEEKRRLVRSSP